MAKSPQSSGIVRKTALQRTRDKLSPRLGLKLPKKLSVDSLAYTVRVMAKAPVQVSGHIISIDSNVLQMHHLRKSGSSKMDVSFFDMGSEVISVSGKKGELGHALLLRETQVEEYKNVSVKHSGNTFLLTDASGDQHLIQSSDLVRVVVSAEADVPAGTSSKSDTKTKKAKKLPSKKKKSRGDEDDY